MHLFSKSVAFRKFNGFLWPILALTFSFEFDMETDYVWCFCQEKLSLPNLVVRMCIEKSKIAFRCY